MTMLFLCICVTAYAQEYSFTPDFTIATKTDEFGVAGGFELVLSGEVTSWEFIDFSFTSEHFGFVAATSLHQDDEYSPDLAHLPGGTLFNSYFIMDQGGLVFKATGMELQLGRLEHHDVIDSPYTLFISSKRNPAILANFRYENDFAFYETRWLELNSDSAVSTDAFPSGFPDRGANIKTYGIKLGNMRFGFQDAAVYAGKSFDLEYFVSPMPNYLIQYVKGTAGRPWSTGANENDVMGAFWDWKPTDELYLDAQVFIDDVSIFGLFDSPDNPWKAAYSFGGKLETDYGIFGFHHALATKYVFSRTRDASDSDYEYSYTYYPDTRFKLADGTLMPISIEDTMIGYYNGENNIAFRLDYEGSWSGIDIVSNLEFVLSGPKSPANAWHEYTHYPEPGTKLFDYSKLEKKLMLEAQASRRFGGWLAFVNLRAGIAFNALELQDPASPEGLTTDSVNDTAWIWRPGDETDYTLSLGLGVRYDIPVMKTLRK
ncbi:MAG: hypothetical protein CVV47_04325 [Spirochaetae bacterium HGW-Spirochaetae-3]|jgi:hypothetical protein|nr:MAG: hypothetical protein CVV47_04325 [Spirochaetae bacterium HGW-Spirochaetae-3]